MIENFYDQNGLEYFKKTHTLDMGHLYEPFLNLVRPYGKILDAGCGSGRDTKWFAEIGYEVTAIDASETMVRLASQYTGQVVQQMDFGQIRFENEFDGVWACASLLHIPLAALDDAMQRLHTALKCGGYWFMSFKSGYGERRALDGRFYLDFEMDKLAEYLGNFEQLDIAKLWNTQDIRKDIKTTWVNAIVRKSYLE